MTERDREQAEEARVEAEEVREEHEVRRRIAEGGTDQHVPGNVEPGRVEAEHHREAERHKMYRRVTALIALPIALIALIPSTIGIVLIKRQTDRLSQEVASRCFDARVNRDAFRSTLIRGFDALGYSFNAKTGKAVESGAPFSYYADHPRERAIQVRTALETIRRFPVINCD